MVRAGLRIAAIGLAALLSACAGELAADASLNGDATLASYNPSASADAGEAGAAAEAETPQRYFIEFRARSFPPFGHTYMIYGPLDESGNPLARNFIGFAPKGGAVGYAVASSPAFVPGTLEPNERDFNMTPLASYRHILTPGQYAAVLAFVANARKEEHWWNLYLNNCNSFAGEMARAAGMKSPLVPTVIPTLFVTEMRNLNENI
ncbi:MAG: hypothetical protein Q8P46_12865 [Hyphomicrobiales bacterium]|nr:hypothetical protein [Hyphomicrobiales bacterium]